jgi:hypothetical protein
MLQWEIKQGEVVDMHQRGPAQRKLRAVEEAN